MNNYIIYFDMAAVFIAILMLVIFIGKKDKHRIHNKVFLILILDELLMSIADMGASNLIARPEATSEPFQTLIIICNYLYHIPHTAIPVIFTLYIFMVTGLTKKYNKKIIAAIFIPYLIVLAMQLTNPFTHMIFFNTPEKAYNRGPLMIFMYIMAVFYVIISTEVLIHYKDSLPSRHLRPLVAFIILSVGAMAFQFFFPNVLIECFIQISMTLYLLVTIENPAELYNSDTNIYNRRAFLMNNITLLRNKVQYKVIIIKIINTEYYMTTLGYSAMNEILNDNAQWLHRITDDDSVYDCSNGIFALILDERMSKRTQQLLKYIENRFSTDFMHKNRVLTLKTQISIIDVPEDVSSIDGIITMLDSPGAKDESRVLFLQKEQLNFIQRRRAIEKAIDRALETNSFKVYFQPIWDVKANKIHSAEALIRLIDDDLGYISPEEFIPVAEKNGRIIQIGQFVFEEVCRMFTMHQLESIGLNMLEINLSTVQCMHRSLPQIFKNTLGHYSLPPIAINLEITESAAINSQEDFLKTINELHDMGFSFSLDDYGTGYSNATYILSMDFDIIKIDKYILWKSEEDECARIVLSNTVKMIKDLKKKILVEGVETQSQRDMMVALGVDYCQGFYFSKPVPQHEFVEFCREFNRSH
ncbi:MAG: EAL domain-containing protein [Treponema sp.]|nr:EAL domain-containing protein [Treponema sp.]